MNLDVRMHRSMPGNIPVHVESNPTQFVHMTRSIRDERPLSAMNLRGIDATVGCTVTAELEREGSHSWFLSADNPAYPPLPPVAPQGRAHQMSNPVQNRRLDKLQFFETGVPLPRPGRRCVPFLGQQSPQGVS